MDMAQRPASDGLTYVCIYECLPANRLLKTTRVDKNGGPKNLGGHS